MKCIRCQKESTYKERGSRTCPGCGKRFAFEPKDGDPFTDAAFQNAMTRVSASGAVKWSLDHLFYELCRMKRPKSKGVVSCGIATGVLLLVALLARFAPIQVRAFILAVAGIGVLIVAAFFFRKKTVPLEKDKLAALFSRWEDVHGNPEGRFKRKERRARPLLARDVTGYSFDRAIVCDRAETVEFLLANKFHFENNCAVLSIDGYPEAIFDTVRGMLKKNPKLEVFALHDATPAGCALAHRLAHDPAWFHGHVGVVDVGLRPAQAKPFAGLLLPASAAVVAEAGITPAEAEWLSRYALELAAIRPEQTLKRLYKAINRQPDSGSFGSDSSGTTSDSGAGVAVDNDSFSADAGSSDGGADGFG